MALASYMNASSSPRSFISYPTFCLQLRREAEEGSSLWAPENLCGRPRESSWVLSSDQLNSSHCGNFGSEIADIGSFSFSWSLLSV